jgi:dTDP-6-deoxy-L-talose 4-dehydrogenase (NAD+)
MKFLVTGANGFIGQYIVSSLLKLSHTVVATGRGENKNFQFQSNSNFKYKRYEMVTEKTSENLLEYFDFPEAVIHLAWEGLPNYNENFHISKNVPSSFNLLSNLIDNGLNNITIAGTCMEYGNQEGKLNEMISCNPNTSYSIAKNKLRLKLLAFQKEKLFNLKWVRIFYMFGKGQNEKSLFYQLDNAIKLNNETFNMSKGDQLRDFLAVEVVAKYLISIAEKNDNIGIINCCSGKPIKVIDFVKSYINQQKSSIKINPGFYPYSDIEPKCFWGDNTKLKKIV